MTKLSRLHVTAQNDLGYFDFCKDQLKLSFTIANLQLLKSRNIKLQKHKTQSPNFCTYTLSENQLHSYNKQKNTKKQTVQ